MALPLSATAIARDPLLEQRIKRHIFDTHRPESFAGLDWNRPVSKETPEFVWEFQLNPEKREDRLPAPCPICSNGKPKYFHIVVAWFQSEGVYRCIGIDCAARFFGRELVDAAKRKFVREKTQRADFDFLFENLGLAPSMLTYFEALAAPVSAVEKLRKSLAQAHVRETLRDLTKDQDGRLVVWETHEVERFDAARNEMRTVFEQIPIELGRITGFSAVASSFDVSKKLRIETERLRVFDHGTDATAQAWVIDNAWDYPDDAAIACFRLRHADTFRQKVESKVRDVLAFFTEANFQAIARVGSDPRSPESLYSSARNGVFRIGQVQSEAVSIRPDFTILDGLPSWPELRRSGGSL